MSAAAVRGSLPVGVPRAAAAVALATVTGAGVAVALAGAAADDGYLVPALVRGRARWIAGPLAGLRAAAPLRTVLLELAAMAVAYAAAVALAPRLRLRWIAAAVALLHVTFLLAPPLLSTDVFNYVDVGRLQVHDHLDPYVWPPAADRHAAAYRYLHWRHAVTVYGPLFTLGARAVGRLPLPAAVAALKALAAAAGLGCAALAGWIAHRLGGSAGRALAAFGLNPVVLVWSVGGAHNDLLMLLALLAGVALVLAARPAAGGALVAAAAAIKLSAGLAVPYLVAGADRRGRVLAGLAATGAAIAAVTVVGFPDHAGGMFAALGRQQRLVGIASVPQGIAYALGLPAVTAHELRALHAALGLWLAGCLVAALRGAGIVAVIGWALLGVVVASTWLLPWYAVWPLAFAAAAGDRRLLVATCAVALSYAIGHIPVS